jgi:hypothetical protein
MRRTLITAAILAAIVGGSALADEAPKEQFSNHTTAPQPCKSNESLNWGGRNTGGNKLTQGTAAGSGGEAVAWNGGVGDAHALNIGSATGGAGAGKARFGSGGGSGRTDPNGRTDPAGKTNEMAMVSHGTTDCASGKH